MAKVGGSGLQVEWINVSYRSVGTLLALALLLAGGGLGAWYYFGRHAPRRGASAAIERAVERFGEASALPRATQVAEILGSAEVALREARDSFESARFDDAELSAMRSETWSLQALRLVGDAEDGDERMVRFYRLEGDVRVKRSGQFSWESAGSQMVLQIGDQVKTSASASAQLIYFDGTVTTIQPGSLLEIRELYEDPNTKVRRVKEQLSFGEVVASTQKRNVKGSFHEVSTERSSARSEDGGEFRVRFDAEKRTAAYDVFQGRIEVATAAQRENLVAGEGIRSTAAGELTSKHALPAVPRLIAPRDQRVFIAESPAEGAVTLTWEAVAGAQRYHLVIADKPLFTEPLYDAEREGTTAVLEDVPPASYYWKVASVSSRGLESRFSAPRRFRVSAEKIRDRSDVVPPLLEITEFVPIGLMVIANGRTEPGASLWVDNDKVDVYDDGTFYAVIRLRKEGTNELRFVAQDTAGNETELVRTAFVDVY